MEPERQNRRKISQVAVGFIVIVFILCRAGSSIVTPLWIDALKNSTVQNISDCNLPKTERRIDPFAILFIVNVLFTAVFGLINIITKVCCSAAITEHETGYDKKEFALAGFADALAALMLLFASSGCRTAPYLQSIAANFSIPLTFFLRFLILRKRPTCRKLSCAILVLIAEVTALTPDFIPGLENEKAKKDDGGASGFAGLLWPICYAMAFVPLAITNIIVEKIMKSKNPSRRSENKDGISTAYILFWCYFFSLVSQVVLFWMDIIPGFGMTNGVVEFCKLVWFNIKCFFGYERCRGYISYVSALCVILVSMGRILQAYFLKYLEGANLLAMIITIPTPLAFLFYTLFDENPLKWHPHAYLSTWLSIVALCIMIPAIYIYNTGPAEVDYNQSNNNNDETEEERRPLLGDYGPNDNNNVNYSGSISVSTQANGLVDHSVQTSPTLEQLQTQDIHPSQQQSGQGNTRPFVRERRVHSDAPAPRRVVERRYTTDGANNQQNPWQIQSHSKNPVHYGYSSSWHAPGFSSGSPLKENELFGDGPREQEVGISNRSSEHFEGLPDRDMRNPNQDTLFDDRSGPIWTGADFNDFHPSEQQTGVQSNTLGTSPLVECDTRHQTAVVYNGYREPVEMRNPSDESDTPEAENQAPDGVSPPPSYTTLPES